MPTEEELKNLAYSLMQMAVVSANNDPVVTVLLLTGAIAYAADSTVTTKDDEQDAGQRIIELALRQLYQAHALTKEYVEENGPRNLEFFKAKMNPASFQELENNLEEARRDQQARDQGEQTPQSE